MDIKRSDNTNAFIIKGITVLIIFAAVVLLLLGGIFAYFYEGAFVDAVSGEISMSPWFYVGTLSVLFASSIVITPFSYGISVYFLNSKTDSASFSDIFYLFAHPKMLFRAILIDTVRRFIITLWRLFILLIAALVEIFILRFFSADSYGFILLHIIAWSIVVYLLFLVKMKYILCKYVLICKHDSRVFECISRGRRAIRGKIFTVIHFYIKYLAVYIFTFLTLGLVRAVRINKSRDSFSGFAVRLVNVNFV